MNPQVVINISCSDHFLEEKSYVFDILFRNLLEIDYKISIIEEHEYILLVGDNTIRIKDVFSEPEGRRTIL